MKITIFYSWQTSTDTRYNKNFILTCLEKAIKKLKVKPEFRKVDFVILEGVRGEPGSSPVASTITDKRIPNCDIFIADLSVANQISLLSKWGLRIFDHKKFRPFQNNNVINEHGVASNAIGTNRIIGVLNTVYGSPNDNPENIPFDIRHLRFPIEYTYSTKTKDKEKVQQKFVEDLTSAIKDTSLFALQHQRDKHIPLQAWDSWENVFLTSQKFFSNEKIIEINELISKWLKNPKASIRLLGLSGLGKTRILLEFFRVKNSDEESILLSSRVLYLNCNLYSTIDYQSIFTKLEKEDRIVILDNCPKSLLRDVLPFVKNEKNNISLITIDSNPEEIEQDKINGVNYIIIKKDEFASVVDQIIAADFSMLHPESKEKIKEFSQGIPMMAVLLGLSIREGERFIGKLNDKDLLDKLLGPKGKELRSRIILKTCSIFNYFGFEEECSSQLNFIATDKNITSLDGENQVIINEFNDVCQFFLKREIFERKGRFLGMRPLPLAMSLAQEWLEPCTPERLINIIQSIAALSEPDRKQLSEAFAEQMKYLGYDEKALLIVEKILGPGSPFDNAEVLNTELGSRLFRSFVEVNPVAASKNLTRIFANMSREELLNIKEGRRNLVWALEKICFDKRTFSEGAKIMYAFAVAENETWSNNATGQFLHLFKILLSGTESDLEERWKIIEWGLSQTEIEYHSLAIRAMGVGLSYGYFTRTSGPEIQGTKKLFDYEPNTTETEIYWTKILKKLTSIVKSGNDLSISASEIIANSIRAIFNAGLARIVLPFLREIADYKQNDWDEGLRGLRMSRKYEKGSLNKELQVQVDELIEALTKKDFGSRYLTLEKSYYFDNDESYNSEKIQDAFIELANEFINSNLPWEIYLVIFYKNQINFSFYFGKRIYELISDDAKKVESFMISSLETIASIIKEERQPTVLAGFVSEAIPEVKKHLYSYLESSEELNYLSFYFISIDKEGKIYFNLLFKLIDEHKCEVHSFDVFEYSNALKELSLEELNEFSEKLFSYGDEGHEIVFDLFFNIGYDDDELKKELFPVFKKCILKLGYNKRERRQQDGFKWTQTICSILENNDESDLAIFINRSIINSITYQNSYNIDYDVQRVYEILLKKHFTSIWPDLSGALLTEGEEYIKFYGLKRILGAHIGGIVRSSGVLFEGNIDAIFGWCEAKKPLAPIRLAELVPIFGEGNNDYSVWNPITLRLINEFGDIEEVLQTIATNMGNFSWTGSIVPLLKSKKDLFNSIADHKLVTVSEWAKKHISYLEMDIKQEKNRDEEMYL